MTTIAWLCGVGIGAAVLLAVSGLRRTPDPLTARSGRRGTILSPELTRRIALGTLGAAVLGLLTGWPVAGAAGAVGGYFATEILSPTKRRQYPIERTEAVAEWTEQLRDTMAGAAGLSQAIAATAPLAPDPIRAEVSAIASRARREPLTPLLRELAERLSDPTADLVVSALCLAASGEAQDLGEVLSSLASAARDDATMRRFVDASRARTRSAVRIITAIALVSLVALLIFGSGYLEPYSSLTGQLVLCIVLACYGGGIALLARMGAETSPERFLVSSHRAEGVTR